MSSKRALHFVFKIGNRKATMGFYREILGMKTLRHEEFEEGCKATCNGPYDGKWSKTMIGFGPEDSSFVLELTYNYGIDTYKMGNDFKGITIGSKKVLAKAKEANVAIDNNTLKSPDGHPFIIEDGDNDSVKKVTLSCSDIKKSTDFWTRLCGMSVVASTPSSVVMHFNDAQCKLELVQIQEPINRAAAFGRFAISCPRSELKPISENMTSEGQTILTPLVSLDTPGKATVEVIIVADPDGHEICFVGDEAFRELSQVDPKADQLLNEGMLADKSDEWYGKKNRKKAVLGE